MNKNIFVCGGGTGGHFFCGLAFAEKYLEIEPDSEVHFIGVKRGIEGRYQFTDPRMKIHFVDSLGFKGVSFFKKLLALFSMAKGCFQAFFLIGKFRPSLIMGVGGYSSVPGVFAGLIWKILARLRVVVVEQNSVAGLANRVFSRLGAEAYSAFETSKFATIELPMRNQILSKLEKTRDEDWPPKKILVMGGSQGALALNRAWLKTLPEFIKNSPGIHICHQSGAYSFKEVQEAYQQLQVSADVFDFSDRINQYIQYADLVISRAGALSLFELMAMNKPAVLVPFPQAADNHQLKNAQAVQISEWIIDQSQLSWKTLAPILASSKPARLSWRGVPRLSWREVLFKTSLS